MRLQPICLLYVLGGNVIVVIGGDDNYKNETEEEQSVISRWAWRKIAHPQFKAEFIDGRKSFVFSWNKQHRAIHEEALLHYFDPNKKGQRFEYQPPQKPSPQKRSPMRATGLERDATKEDSVQQLSSVASYLQMGKEISCKAEGRRKEFNTSSPCTGKNHILSLTAIIDHFTVVCSVSWPLNGSEAGGELALIQTSLLLFCKSSCSDAN